jgi:hypothetical protein
MFSMRRRLRSRRPLPTQPIHRRPRPTLELLEDRALLSASALFHAAVSYDTNSGPAALAIGDFNGDGKPDIVSADTAADAVSVLLSSTDVAFQPSVDYATGNGPVAVAVGDFNNDGRLDIVTANRVAGTVSVLVGNGDGTFADAQDYPVGSGPDAVAVADFNGDGIPDVAVGLAGDSAVAVLLGRGDGTFGFPHKFATASAPTALAVGDFNGDGKPDIVAALSNVGASPGQLAVFYGLGSGGFQSPQYISSSAQMSEAAVSVVAGDFNGDGLTDYAVVDYGTASGRGAELYVLLGRPGNSIQLADAHVVGSGPATVVEGDFNGDGVPDLAVTDPGTDAAPGGAVSLFYGTGTGTFTAGATLPVGSEPAGLVAADFNHDGLPDLATADAGSTQNPGSTVSVLLSQQPVPHFRVTTAAVGTAGGANQVTVTAVDGSGIVDTSYAGTIHFTSSDSNATLPDDYTFQPGDNGVHTFSASVSSASVQSVSVTEAAPPIGQAPRTGTAFVTIQPAAATYLEVSVAATASLGDQLDVAVTAVDPFGNTQTGYTGTVHLSSTVAGDTLPDDYTFQASDYGTHTFTVTPGGAGSRVLTAADTDGAALAGTGVVTVSLTDNEAFVAQAWFDLFGQLPDTNTLLQWSGELDQGTSRMDLASELTQSDDYFTALIQPLYNRYLGRDATDAEVSNWIDRLDNGLTDEELEAKLLSSPECYQFTGGTDQTWIDAVYEDVLGRPADAGGAAFWLAALPNSGRYTVALGFTESAEHESQVIQSDYDTFLHRPVSPAEIQSWVSFFMNGDGTNEDVISGFLGSPEYSQRVQSVEGTVSTLDVQAVPFASLNDYDLTVTALNALDSPVTGYLGTVHFSSTDTTATLAADYTFTATDAGVHTFQDGFVSQTAGNATVTVSDTGSSGPSGHTTMTVTPLTTSAANSKYVSQAYQDVFGRPVDSADQNAWTALLDLGLSRERFALLLTHNAEYYANLVVPAYTQYLGRAPSAQEELGWIQAMENGLTDEQLQAGFIGSDEYYQHTGGTDQAWVEALYQDLLGRAPDPAGLAAWLSLLAGGASRASIAFGFAASAEREGQVVVDDYQHYLDRAPGDAEIQAWVSLFVHGQAANEDVVAGFVASDEYYLHATGP